VHLAETASVVASVDGDGGIADGHIAATSIGGTLALTLGAGDVAEIVGPKSSSSDFSGSIISADKPVQVISSAACLEVPDGAEACDHVEETILPVETLGKHYVVTRPTGPNAGAAGAVVRLYGNADATGLTFTPSRPVGCPAFLNAGQVASCGRVDMDFDVVGDKAFGVAIFQLGAELADPEAGAMSPEGDPSQSFAIAVEQYRKRYVFVAPTNYTKSFLDVVAPAGATLTLDGSPVTSTLRPLAGTPWWLARIPLGPGKDGTHVVEGSVPISIQVIGYAVNVSYQYPGGASLRDLSAPAK
jgi:hypothetical protein